MDPRPFDFDSGDEGEVHLPEIPDFKSDEVPHTSIVGMDVSGPLPQGKGVELGGMKEMFICPYNEGHRVGFGHFAYHLENCRKAAPPERRELFVVCEYNTTHHMLREVYDEHLKLCPDRRLSLAQKFSLPSDLFGDMKAAELIVYEPGFDPNRFKDLKKTDIKSGGVIEIGDTESDWGYGDSKSVSSTTTSDVDDSRPASPSSSSTTTDWSSSFGDEDAPELP